MPSKTYHIGAHAFDAPALSPGLYLVATPIGNLGDVTIRALQTLAAAHVIYCEDTRVTGKLLERYGIRNAMKNYHEHNAQRARPEILAALQGGQVVALASDAGTPLVSDPGFKLVEAVIAEGLPVTALPGASAVLTAVQLSGLASDRFSFFGFLPEKKAARREVLRDIASHPLTVVTYESPHRVLDTLSDMAEVLGNRPIAATRELTKLHEEVIRGSSQMVRDMLAAKPSIKGEFAIVIAGAPEVAPPADDITIETAIAQALTHLSASKAAALVAKSLGLRKDDVYARILKRKANE